MIEVQPHLTRCCELSAEFVPQPDGKLKVKAPAPLPEDLREALESHKHEILTVLTSQQPSLDRRAWYQQAAEEVRDDCWKIDAYWLLDRYPRLWEQIRDIDRHLSQMEREHVAASEYQQTLEHLVNVVKNA